MSDLYICNDCGEVFDRPKHTHNGGYYDEDWCECPSCASTDYDPAEKCEICGEILQEKKMLYGLCPSCVSKAADKDAARYVMNDPDLRDAFAWWLHQERKRT